MASLHGAACRSGRGLTGGEGGEQQGRAQGLRRDVARLTEGRGAGKLHDEAKLAAGLRDRWLYGVKAAQLI